MALNANLSQVGRFKRVVTKAKTKPNAVPATPTEQPSKILLIAERLSYQLSKKGRRFSKVAVNPKGHGKQTAQRIQNKDTQQEPKHNDR